MNIKFSFPISVEICNALNLDEDTFFNVYFENGELVVEPINEFSDDSQCFSEDGSGCDDCDFYCPECGACLRDDFDCEDDVDETL